MAAWKSLYDESSTIIYYAAYRAEGVGYHDDGGRMRQAESELLISKTISDYQRRTLLWYSYAFGL